MVMGANKDRGVISAGKLADMVLIDGDPTQNIRDINEITTVIKGGKVYDPAAIEKALGIAPRRDQKSHTAILSPQRARGNGRFRELRDHRVAFDLRA